MYDINFLSNTHVYFNFAKIELLIGMDDKIEYCALFARTARVSMPHKPRQPRHTISGALRRDAFK